jgi:hypothetical protein
MNIISLDTPASSTTNTGRHDIAEILLKVALNTKNEAKSLLVNFLYLVFNVLILIIPDEAYLRNAPCS